MSETTTNSQRRPRQPDRRLTEQQLLDLITRERPYKVFDGNSLFVLVSPSGQGRRPERGFERLDVPETDLLHPDRALFDDVVESSIHLIEHSKFARDRLGRGAPGH